MKKTVSAASDWKSTLLMPRSDFSLRAHLATEEPRWRDFWQKNRIYERALKQNARGGQFVLHDGPPYANGSIHLGHALNKILKDIVLRNKTLEGYATPFVAGWDTHGLPIENQVLTKLRQNYQGVDPARLRQAAQAYAEQQIQIQRQQFSALQLWPDLTTYYQTDEPTYQARQLEVLAKLVADKLVFRALKPIYWSPSSQSALAEAEIVYKTLSSPQIYVALNLVSGNQKVPPHTKLVLMTTTPWTLPANSALAAGGQIKYALVKTDGQLFLVAEACLEKLAQLVGWTNYQAVQFLSGQDLVGLTYQRPFSERPGPVVLSEHVDAQEGTGLVHLAPLFGVDDYQLGQKYDLEMVMHLDDRGVLNQASPIAQGQFYLKANPIICQFLRQHGQLVFEQAVTHSYPHDWRTHQPVIYRATKQWFVNLAPLRGRLKKALTKVSSYPGWGTERLLTMAVARETWTISRQRSWGVPLTIFYDRDGQPVFEPVLFKHIIQLVAKHGSQIWWDWPTEQLVPTAFAQRAQDWKKETDIMDVWFDSGTSFRLPFLKSQPADLCLEGADQFRGWFNSSLVNSVAWHDQAPFKKIISHGFVLDQAGHKMAKSLGNVIDPAQIINRYGAEILRLWVATSEYSADVNVSEVILEQVASLYRGLRSKIKFMLGVLFDFVWNPQAQPVYSELDHLVLRDLARLKKSVRREYDAARFNQVVNLINLFVLDLSSYYLEVSKDALYADAANDPGRRAIQSVLYQVLIFILQALAPVLPTTCEQAYQAYHFDQKKDSIFLTKVDYRAQFLPVDSERWKQFFQLKDLVFKMLEEAKQAGQIGRSYAAQVTLEKKWPELEKWDLAKLLMVGRLVWGETNRVERFDSVKCVRCWNHYLADQVNQESLCQRCQEVLVLQGASRV